jgi:hypothetical protein
LSRDAATGVAEGGRSLGLPSGRVARGERFNELNGAVTLVGGFDAGPGGADGRAEGNDVLAPSGGGFDDGETEWLASNSPGVDVSDARWPSAVIASCTENTTAHSLQRILAVGRSASLSSVMRYLVSHLGQ